MMSLPVKENFYPRPPRGGRRAKSQRKPNVDQFLSTPSARRATPPPSRALSASPNFYPRPPRGGRQCSDLAAAIEVQFLSTPSARRATGFRRFRREAQADFYPRPPRGGRLSPCSLQNWSIFISIHALREEGDSFVLPSRSISVIFLSTPSARRATSKRSWSISSRK